jgi:hypothetical protein
MMNYLTAKHAKSAKVSFLDDENPLRSSGEVGAVSMGVVFGC